MKIQIREQDHNFTLVLPTRLIFNKISARIANHFARKYAPDAMAGISPEALEALCTELGRIKKKYGSWDLVEVDSADGEKVIITL